MFWLLSAAAILLLILLLGLFSNCSVVKTNYADIPSKQATVYYYLPESIIKIKGSVKVAVYYNADSTLSESSRVIEQSFSTSTEMIADTRDLLSLNYTPNALMSDEIKYIVNSKGLLETINIVTDDRTSDIIAKLAEAPQTILGATTGQAKADGIIIKIKEFSSDFAIKSSAISTGPTTIKWNILITNELGKDEYQTVHADFQLSSADAIANPPRVTQLINNDTNSTRTETEGILTRPIKNMQLNIKSAAGGLSESLPVNLVIADVEKLITIPVNRTAFVKRTNKIGIADGIIISNEITKPSSVEGFVSIPINVAKAVISVPGQLITFKIDNTKQLTQLETEKLSLEKALQDNQKFALSKEQELGNIKIEMQKAALTNENDLKKIKLDLEKALLEAEKNKLQAQKDLDDLRKQIEELKKGK